MLKPHAVMVIYSKPSPGCAGWDRLNCSSLQYRSALVVARMRNIVYSTFDRITSREVAIRGSMFQNRTNSLKSMTMLFEQIDGHE